MARQQMNGYVIPDDGKVHVNFSSLKRCTTAKGVMAVIDEQKNGRIPFENEAIRIGKLRHNQWEEEGRKTNMTPEDFKEHFQVKVDFIEHSFAVEIFKGVILHFRPDVVSLSECAVIDYKKTVKGVRQFHNDMQLIVYAYGLQLLGHRMKKSVHLLEVWNKEATEILSYQMLDRPLALADIARALKWIEERAVNLITAQNVLDS